jgi:hypothetical protein
MEKISRKEKTILTVFGLILLAIIVQLVREGGEKKPAAGEAVKAGEADISPAGDLLRAGKVRLTASSHNENYQTANRLIDGKRNTYWHVALDQAGKPAWVVIDFGPGNSRQVHGLLALPRNKFPRQFFRRAELFGSSDGKNWKSVSKIIQGKVPRKAEWLKWTFKNDRAYRYYRFLITDGHEDKQSHHFYSMAELALLN